MPLPHAKPFLPNRTGTGDATAVQGPPLERSNNCILPRIEFQSGAMATMSWEQSFGTPSARAPQAKIAAIAKNTERKIDINVRKSRRTAY